MMITGLSILCPIYAFKGEKGKKEKRQRLLGIIFVNRHAMPNIDIKPRGRGHQKNIMADPQIFARVKSQVGICDAAIVTDVLMQK